jgi:hypothetical protein
LSNHIACTLLKIKLFDHPTIPVPLKGELDVALDLGVALVEVYDEAGYDLSIDYSQSPPPPALTVADESWWRSQQ